MRRLNGVGGGTRCLSWRIIDLDQPGRFADLTITWIGGDGDTADGAWMGALTGIDAYDG